MIQIICLVLVVSLFISVSLAKGLYHSNLKLRDEIRSLTKEVGKEKKNKEELVLMDRGSKAIYPLSLVYHQGTSNEKKFKVTYEVEILEVSVDNVKVNAIDFSGECPTGNDPANRSGILAFMQGKWIPKSEIELVVDASKRRNAKLQELLGDE